MKQVGITQLLDDGYKFFGKTLQMKVIYNKIREYYIDIARLYGLSIFYLTNFIYINKRKNEMKHQKNFEIWVGVLIAF